MDEANVYIAPLVGLPQLPVVPLDVKHDWNSHKFGTTWKLPGVRAYVGDRAFAWIDDDLWQDVFDWAEEREAPAMPVRIDPMTGLDEIVVMRLRRWAEDVKKTPETVRR